MHSKGRRVVRANSSVMSVEAYIAIGSNLGDRMRAIESAIDAISESSDITLVAQSSIIETDPVGPQGQGRYLNGVICVQSTLEPRELLERLLVIEHKHGRDRDREIRWGARTLDLDLLVFGDRIIDERGLCVPHPRLHERAFVLIPLCELAPDITIPGQEKTPRAMLEALRSD